LTSSIVPSSFRDPSGFVFEREGDLFRQVNAPWRRNYDLLMGSGLYASLVEAGLLVPHEEADVSMAASGGAHRVLRPERIPFVSHPYEWSFSQLKDAALTTLRIQRIALDHGMSLRDASAFNIQFRAGKPILIDTLSFEEHPEGKPWVAYRQFCQHFLAPLALAAYRDIRLTQLARVHIDGIPLDLASELLPFRARLRPPLLLHVFFHARSQVRHQSDADPARAKARRTRPFTLQAFRGLIDSLEKAVAKLTWRPGRSPWAGYYAEAESYSTEAMEHKQQLIGSFLDRTTARTAWDLGANIGLFSRMAAAKGIQTVSFDLDPAAVEANYAQVVREAETHLLPLVMDLVNPSPGIGWENRERQSLSERGPTDLVLALALVHHLAIANNVPLDRLAGFFAGLSTWLIVEFVPKSDPKVQGLLVLREDVFPGYTQQGFEQAFGEHFDIKSSEQVKDSDRVIYLMRSKR
jgi:ribosomal protein L11 methylase PrmA